MNVVLGIISGETDSTNYTNQLGVFYGLNQGPSDPIVLLNTSGSGNVTSENLLCNSVVSDPDGDSMTVFVSWYLNSSLNLTVNYTSVASETNFSAILDSGNTTKSQNWSCSMMLYDGSLYSNLVNSSNLIILNSAPVIFLESPSDGSLTADRTPLFVWNASDADADDLTYEINITPYYGENPSALDLRNETGLTALNYTPSSDLQLLYDNGYHYRWKVRADDEEVNGSWSSEWMINLSSTVGINILVNEVSFGRFNYMGI